jgi:hypothetical protein
LFPQQQADKTTVQQLEFTGFQDPQAAAAAETPGIQYDNIGGEVRRKEWGVGYIFPPKNLYI